MTEQDRTAFLEIQNTSLSSEKGVTLRALEYITSNKSMHISLNKLDSIDPILENSFKTISEIIPLKCAGYFIVDETNGHFSPYKFYPDEICSTLTDETDRLILNGSFAGAIKENAPLITAGPDKKYILLHAMTTVSRVRGVFISLLDIAKEDIPDPVYYLITIIMNDTAHQLESFELYSRNKKVNTLLSESVARLEESEIRLKDFNEKLENEVQSRTKELQETNGLLENEISERKKIEKLLLQQKEALQSLNTTLEQRVDIETENRRKSERILHEQSKMAAMGQMMKAVSHQWRQPLNALALLIQDLTDEYEHCGISREYLHESVDKSLKLVMHMSSTIDDFCDLVKSDVEKNSFDILTSVREVVQLVEKHYNSFGIFFDLGPGLSGHEGKATTVKGDSGMFKQVMLNLLSNAKEAISKRLEIGKAEKGLISIDADSDGTNVNVTVGDNGGGIDESIIDRVFEPYFTTKRNGKGTGIGLYISSLVIGEHMGGTIKAENGPTGAIFILTLPVSE